MFVVSCERAGSWCHWNRCAKPKLTTVALDREGLHTDVSISFISLYYEAIWGYIICLCLDKVNSPASGISLMLFLCRFLIESACLDRLKTIFGDTSWWAVRSTIDFVKAMKSLLPSCELMIQFRWMYVNFDWTIEGICFKDRAMPTSKF